MVLKTGCVGITTIQYENIEATGGILMYECEVEKPRKEEKER